MPPSAYELGMGEFDFPMLAIYIVGVGLFALVGWITARKDRKNGR